MRILSDSIQNKSSDYAANLEKQFNSAIAEINTKIAAWYQRFAVNNSISLSEANRLLKSDELKEFKWTVQEYIAHGMEYGVNGSWAKELENASARVHISRLDSLKLQLRQLAEVLASKQLNVTTKVAEYAYTQSYYHTAFEIQRGIGVGFTMQAVNSDTVQKILSRPWTTDNQTFTARCWANKEKLVATVNQELTRMIITGASPDKAIDTIARQFETSKSNAGRLVMTESAYFSAAGQKDCYNELGVEQYQIVGTLSVTTCPKCGELDGKILPMSEYKPGITANPFHPRCRCCTAPYFPDIADVGERIARDSVTGESYTLPANTTYKQWKAMQDEKYGAGTIDKRRKMVYNESADKAQYEKYKNLLGSNAPKTFAEFQMFKYSDDWNVFKAYARSIETGELTPLSDFEFYKTVSKEIDNVLVGQTTKSGIVITGKSNHFIARTIGSVEQRRNGVAVQTSLNALLNPNLITAIKNSENGLSVKFNGDGASVSVNPETGILIQVNPLSITSEKESK